MLCFVLCFISLISLISLIEIIECNTDLDEYISFRELLDIVGIVLDDRYFNESPSITIYGESHIREKCINKKQKMVDKAKKGEFILCLEGLPYDSSWSNTYINGIEYSVAHFTAGALLHRVQLLQQNIISSNPLMSKNDYIKIKLQYLETFQQKYIYPQSTVHNAINNVFEQMELHLKNPGKLQYSSSFAVFWSDKMARATIEYTQIVKNGLLRFLVNLRYFMNSSTKTEKDIFWKELININMNAYIRFSELFNIFLMAEPTLQLNENDYKHYQNLIDNPVDDCIIQGMQIPHILTNNYNDPVHFRDLNDIPDVDPGFLNPVFGGTNPEKLAEQFGIPVDESLHLRRLLNDKPIYQTYDAQSNCDYFGGIHYNSLEFLLDKFAIKYRDPFMAKSITQCYAKAIKHKKNLKVIVGDAHLSGKSKLLHLLQQKVSKIESAKSINTIRMSEHCSPAAGGLYDKNCEKVSENAKQTVFRCEEFVEEHVITTALQSYLKVKEKRVKTSIIKNIQTHIISKHAVDDSDANVQQQPTNVCISQDPFSHVPTIMLRGQDSKSSQCRNAKDSVIQRALSKEAIVCLSGAPYITNWIDDVMVNGIENQLAYFIVWILKEYIEFAQIVGSGLTDIFLCRQDIVSTHGKQFFINVNRKMLRNFVLFHDNTVHNIIEDVFRVFEQEMNSDKYIDAGTYNGKTETDMANEAIQIANKIIAFNSNNKTKTMYHIDTFINSTVNTLDDVFSIDLLSFWFNQLIINNEEIEKLIHSEKIKGRTKYVWQLLARNPVKNYRNALRQIYKSVNNMDIFLDKFALEFRDYYLSENAIKCFKKGIITNIDVEIVIGDGHLSNKSKFVANIKTWLFENGYDTNIVHIIRRNVNCDIDSSPLHEVDVYV